MHCLKVLSSLVFHNASGKEFQIFRAKKQNEFFSCRTEEFSEFLELRVRQRFSISSRNQAGGKSLRILKVLIAMFICPQLPEMASELYSGLHVISLSLFSCVIFSPRVWTCYQ